MSRPKRKLDTRIAKEKLTELVTNVDAYTPLEFAAAMTKITFLATGIDTDKTIPEYWELLAKHRLTLRKVKSAKLSLQRIARSMNDIDEKV